MLVPVTSAVEQRLPSWLRRDWVWGLVLILAVALVYQPVWYAGFIWDDDFHLTNNPCIVGPLGLKEIWTTSQARICPLVLTTFWVEHALWGLNPLPYHLVNVLLQGMGAVVLWRVLRSLRIPGAWMGAALWALHPVQVETVAWITEMKNTESGLFYLLSILFFVRWLQARDSDGRTGGRWNYALTLLFAALAMASKSSTVILPLILCLCAWWVEGRWQWRTVGRVIPIFLMSVAASAVSMWTQNLEGANEAQWARSWPQRVATSGDVVWFYLGKLVWPHPLIFIYPRWEIDAGRLVSYLPLLALIVIGAVLWGKREAWARSGFFALAYFLAALLPVLGLVDHYFLRYSFVGDHFQYLACMTPLALAGAGLAWLADWLIPKRPKLQSILGAGLLLVLGLVSWQRVWAFANVETLWTDTLARNPNCWIAQTNLGMALLAKGRVDEATAHYEKALELNPNIAEAHNDLGQVLLHQGRVDEAIGQFQDALENSPNLAEVHNNLGVAFFQKRQTAQGLAQFKEALRLDPSNRDAQDNLAKVEAMMRQKAGHQ